jgi:hypothetical protein
MRAWAPIWLFPVAMLGTVALISLASTFGYFLAIMWGWVLFPHGAALIRSQPRPPGAVGDGSGFRQGDTEYWRTTLR